MKVWTLNAPKQLEQVTTDPTVLTDVNDVKVKIEQVLFASTDYKIYDGTIKQKYPFVLGRNAVGVVSEVKNGEKTMLAKMQRVAVEPYIVCRSCESCMLGDFANCANMERQGFDAEGLLRNFVDLPHARLHKLPDNLSDEKALFISYVSLGINIVDALDVREGKHVAVFASTKVGVILAQLLAYYQALPIFISDRPEVLQMAQEKGIFYTVDAANGDVEREIQVITGGKMCSNSVFFTSSSCNIRDVYNVAAFNGKICISGEEFRDSKLSVGQIVNKHLKIFGVYNGYGNFPSAINLLVTGKIDVDGMIGEKLSFDHLAEDLEKTDIGSFAQKSAVVVVD